MNSIFNKIFKYNNKIISIKNNCIVKSTGNNNLGRQLYKASEPKRDAYNAASNLNISMPIVILVNPFLDQNVGSVARAMLNFGLTELRVVDPVCDIKSDNARALSCGAFDILENAKIYSTLKECISDLNKVMATTIRPRGMSHLVYSPKSAAKAVLSIESTSKVGILFGRETNGLNNDEVAMADSIITISSFPKFSSLNLAQAVNIVGYEFWQHNLELQGSAPPEAWLRPRYSSGLATKQELDGFFERLETFLDQREYQVEPRKRELIYKNIRNIFQRTMMTKTETAILQGVLTYLVKKPRDDSIITNDNYITEEIDEKDLNINNT